MPSKKVDQFIATYGPIAQQVGREINVDPNLILSQWGLESGWGKAMPGSFNIAGIKDFSGYGASAKDNKTGSIDKYVEFEDPQSFGAYYAHMIKRNFPAAVGAGSDPEAFAKGLSTGRYGSYFEVPVESYQKALKSFRSAIPESKSVDVEPQKAQSEDGLQLVDAPAQADSEGVEPDTSGASQGERFLLGGAGATVGAAVAGGRRVGEARSAKAVRQAGREEAAREAARIQAQRAAAAGALATPGGVPTAPGGAPATPAGPPSVVRQQIPSGGPDGGRLARGQTGTMPYNYAKAAGLTDIEAGRALDMTKQAGGVHDLTTQRREGMQRIQQLFPGERYVENPRFGGLLTLDQSVGGGPRQSFAVQGPIQDVPPGTLMGPAAPPPEGTLRQLPPRQPVSTVASPPVRSGLDAVADTFKSLMKPVASAAGTVAKYALPPAAGLSAGLDVAEAMHEYDKPKDQRDYTKMLLKGASAVGGGLSMFPPAAVVGVPLSLGASAIQAYREDPGMLERAKRLMQQRLQEAGQAPYSDPMTGFMP